MKIHRFSLLPLLLFSFGFLLGCHDEYAAEFNAPYQPPKPKPIEIKRLIVQKPTVNFIYSPVNKRDPFRPPFLEVFDKTKLKNPNLQENKPRIEVPKTELERFELDQLKVAATITGVANPMAMIQLPGGKGVMAKRGTAIGRNGGRIARIQSDGIEISEVFRDVTGKRIVNRVTLRILEEQQKADGSVEIDGRSYFLDASGEVRSKRQDATVRVQNRTSRLFRQRN